MVRGGFSTLNAVLGRLSLIRVPTVCRTRRRERARHTILIVDALSQAFRSNAAGRINNAQLLSTWFPDAPLPVIPGLMRRSLSFILSTIQTPWPISLCKGLRRSIAQEQLGTWNPCGGSFFVNTIPRPSFFPLLDPKYPLLGTIYPYLRVQGGPGCLLARRLKANIFSS